MSHLASSDQDASEDGNPTTSRAEGGIAAARDENIGSLVGVVLSAPPSIKDRPQLVRSDAQASNLEGSNVEHAPSDSMERVSDGTNNQIEPGHDPPAAEQIPSAQ